MKKLGRYLIGEVKFGDTTSNNNDKFLDEVAGLMEKYRINYMWLAWQKYPNSKAKFPEVGIQECKDKEKSEE